MALTAGETGPFLLPDIPRLQGWETYSSSFPQCGIEEKDRQKTEKRERIGKVGPGEIARWGD